MQLVRWLCSRKQTNKKTERTAKQSPGRQTTGGNSVEWDKDNTTENRKASIHFEKEQIFRKKPLTIL